MYRIIFIKFYLYSKCVYICFKLFTSYSKSLSIFYFKESTRIILNCLPEIIFAFKCSTLSISVSGPYQLISFSFIPTMFLTFSNKLSPWVTQNFTSFSVSFHYGMSSIFSSIMFSFDEVIQATPLSNKETMPFEELYSAWDSLICIYIFFFSFLNSY